MVGLGFLSAGWRQSESLACVLYYRQGSAEETQFPLGMESPREGLGV